MSGRKHSRCKAEQPLGPPRAARHPWPEGKRCPALQVSSRGAAPIPSGAALPGRAVPVPPGERRAVRRRAGGAAEARPDCCGQQEALGCTTSLVPAGAALPPSSFLPLFLLLHLFHLFYRIYLFAFTGIIKMRKSERCFWLLSTNLSVTQAETT